MRARSDILADIDSIDGQLSPENLHLDGMRSPADATKVARKLNKQRALLVRELHDLSNSRVFGTQVSNAGLVRNLQNLRGR